MRLFGFVLQLAVLASDGGSPPKTSTASVEITVRRNLQRPKFEPDRYETRVLETYPLGATLVTVVATDDDVTVRTTGERFE